MKQDSLLARFIGFMGVGVSWLLFCHRFIV
nr:MAG TPA: hypothetical protein [Caudoviricetes sp.]